MFRIIHVSHSIFHLIIIDESLDIRLSSKLVKLGRRAMIRSAMSKWHAVLYEEKNKDVSHLFPRFQLVIDENT
jgi:hypothetical protein